MSRSKRKQREIERKRRDILDAAVTIFAQKGYNGATMEEIAAEAGYAAPSLYGYFKGKQAIFEALAEQVREELAETFTGWMPTGLDLRNQLELLMRRQMEWANYRSGVLQVLSAERHEKPENLYQTLLAEFIAKSGRTEELRGLSPERAALYLNGLLKAVVDECYNRGDDPQPETMGDILEFFFHGLCGRQECGHVEKAESA